MSGQKYAGVDVNGVLFDLEGRRQAVEFVSGKRIPRTCFGDKKYVLRAYNVTPQQYDEAMALYFEDDSFFNSHTSLMSGAANGIWKLYCAGFKVAAISTCDGLDERKLKILHDRFKLPIEEIIPGKSLSSKTELYDQCSIVIDDSIEHLTPLLDVPDVELILMIPPDGGTGSDVIASPIGLDPRIRVGRGWQGIDPYLPRAARAA